MDTSCDLNGSAESHMVFVLVWKNRSMCIGVVLRRRARLAMFRSSAMNTNSLHIVSALELLASGPVTATTPGTATDSAHPVPDMVALAVKRFRRLAGPHVSRLAQLMLP